MKPVLIPTAFIAVLALSVPAFALGSDSTSNTNSEPTCPLGKVFDKEKKDCVKMNSRKKPAKKKVIKKKKTKKKSSGLVPDADMIRQGWALAYAGRYEAAIVMFEHVIVKDQPEVLNGLGYSNRKQGRIHQAIAYYKRAINLDPDYVKAREYLGEGYLSIGKAELARAQLRQIKQRCGTSCKSYTVLAAAISAAKAKG